MGDHAITIFPQLTSLTGAELVELYGANGNGQFATTQQIADKTNASNIVSGTLANARLPAKAGSTTTPANPTGTNTVLKVMMGLAGSITPTSSGRVLVIISGQVTGSGPSNGASSQLSYGTGSAPANGAALTGTQAGAAVSNTGATTSISGFTVTAVLTGLTVSTPYWLDLAVSQVGANITGLANITITAVEL